MKFIGMNTDRELHIWNLKKGNKQKTPAYVCLFSHFLPTYPCGNH